MAVLIEGQEVGDEVRVGGDLRAAGRGGEREAGGVAAMEVLARDLRSLGLYTARSLSYDGVEYEMLVHALSP